VSISSWGGHSPDCARGARRGALLGFRYWRGENFAASSMLFISEYSDGLDSQTASLINEFASLALCSSKPIQQLVYFGESEGNHPMDDMASLAYLTWYLSRSPLKTVYSDAQFLFPGMQTCAEGGDMMSGNVHLSPSFGDRLAIIERPTDPVCCWNMP